MPFDGSTFRYERKNQKPYLKCGYTPGTNRGECIISFTTIEKTAEENPIHIQRDGIREFNENAFMNHIIVNNGYVIVTDKRNRRGLVNVGVFGKTIDRYLVGILNKSHVSKRYVSNSEIVWH